LNRIFVESKDSVDPRRPGDGEKELQKRWLQTKSSAERKKKTWKLQKKKLPLSEPEERRRGRGDTPEGMYSVKKKKEGTDKRENCVCAEC